MQCKLKLSGWQRLWIVISILYLIPVLAASYLYIIPKKSTIYHDQVYEYLKIIIQSDPNLQNHLVYEFRNAYPEKTDKELIDAIESKTQDLNLPDEQKEYIDDHIKEVKTKYDIKLNNYKYTLIKAIVETSLIFFIPVICIYILGSALGWVYKGFKQK